MPNYFDEIEMGGRRREKHKKIFRIISKVVSEKACQISSKFWH